MLLDKVLLLGKDEVLTDSRVMVPVDIVGCVVLDIGDDDDGIFLG